MENFTPVSGFFGGLLIGIASVLLLWAAGRIAGISGIVGGLLVRPSGDTPWRIAFIAGLLIGGAIYIAVTGRPFVVELQAGWPMMIVAGLLVGFGTRMGGGCTSGHGVCGIGRLSMRSIVATVTFMAVAIATVFVVRHLLGG